jgi:hypothetical protein
MSTDSRGRSRTNKLMAVPPLSAKLFSWAMKGIARSKSAT